MHRFSSSENVAQNRRIICQDKRETYWFLLNKKEANRKQNLKFISTTDLRLSDWHQLFLLERCPAYKE